ncbi:threonine ammonia-lyase [Mesoplasma syrphidae]|uniref:threonine ammonia-lyase n=1 Tax=Mesoplasma syrphidae TaxID=225999 RepID=A0A2K9BU35_9MOLU|nr:threonine ammonia-lyase [Mesoplasma syrphidae]AUF83230.1 threonine ammonia-lyase [Mesoplasma syrphidae]
MKPKISKLDFESTYDKICDFINITPTIHAVNLSNITENDVYVKLENLQKAGSFKLRGALAKILSIDEKVLAKGIVAASAGNHSQGVAYAAKMLGIEKMTTIVMPENAPNAKIKGTKKYGVEVILHGKFFDDANNKAIEIANETGKALVHAFNDLDIIKGQGTIGIEILEAVKDLEYIFIPVGGGGLCSGIGQYVKLVNPNCKIIAVESANVPSYFEARNLKQPILIKGKTSIADGIAVKETGNLTFEILQDVVDDVVLVSEEEIAQAILLLFEHCRIVAEGAGATAIAAVLFNKLALKNKKIMCVLSGGNIDVTSFLNITNRALIDLHRRVVLQIKAAIDKNNLANITTIISHNKVQIHSIFQSQQENYLKINEETYHVCVDINDPQELISIINQIKEKGFVLNNESYLKAIL